MSLSQTEFLARALFKHYFPHQRVVYGSRPEWLVNPKTGHALEIDILFPDLKLAVEIQGVQHGRFTPGLHRDLNGFNDQIDRDTTKRHACAAKGYEYLPLSIFQLTRDSFHPMVKRLYQAQGKLPEFEHIREPHALFDSVRRLSRVRSVPKRKVRHRRRWLLF